MNEMGLRRIPPDQSSGSGHTFGTLRHPSIGDPILSKRVCFYKSGDPQFSGLRLVINNRTFKTFDALLDSLSKKVPLAFGVRNITTPHGVHAISSLDELEDGKSYICSDRRKVKPINLALARKKLPPWYHARPVSSRRRTVKQARFFPGRSIHKTQMAVLRTPKRLLVFRNGEPSIKQIVVLHKKTTPSYESILEYISELMQYHVVKLHTPDGKRVDGLPGLILCSGTVVAAGREPFKPAIYRALKTPPAVRRHAIRQKPLNRKKKSLSYASDLRNFSPSSERFIVDQIHNTLAGSSYGVPSIHTNSVELESNRVLESVAETEEDDDLGDGAVARSCSLPNDDDIEKSFRVNQDGSMTVEMRVRLTLKEEETVHWTTTLSRSCVASQPSTTCLPEPEPMDGMCSPTSTSLDLQSSAESSNDTVNKDKTKDDNDEDPPSFSNEAFSENCNEEDEMKTQTDMVFPRRVPTPGHKQISQKQTSVESVKSVTANGIQEDMVGSYSFREQSENGRMTEQYCIVKQSSSRPVPKPRRLGSVDQYSRNVSGFKSEGMSEVLQIESSGEEVTETVLHIYEQQTCQDNYLANICTPFMSASEANFGRPATSETGRFSCSNEFEPELYRPSTASEAISIWRTESMSVTSDLKSPPQKNDVNKTTNGQQNLQKSTKFQVLANQGESTKDKRASSKQKVINKHVRRIMTPIKRQNKNPADAPESQRKAKIFSSAGFIKRIYGNKSKPAKSLKNLKKRPRQNGIGSVSKNSLPDDATKQIENEPSASNGSRNESIPFETSKMGLSSSDLSQPRGVLIRQTSVHMEKKNDKSFNSNASSTLGCSTNEYVENWLEKAHLHQQTENIGCLESENKEGLITEAEEAGCLGATLKTETHQLCESQPGNVLGTSVKLKVQSFENKSSNSPVEKTVGSHDPALSHANSMNTGNSGSSLQTHTEDPKPLPINGICPEMEFESAKENKSNSVKILFQKASPSDTLSMDLPPPPTSAEIAALSNPEYFILDASSVASSPLYRLSSSKTDTHSATVSPSSDEVLSPNDNAKEIASSVQENIPSKEHPLPRVPSIKRAPLVSNLSFERKMSLRKASLDKHTLSSDATSKTNSSSATVNTTGSDVPLNVISSTRTEQPIKALPEETQQTMSDLISTQSCCMSVSPTSLTSDERVSSASISSSDDLVPSSLPLKETKDLNGGSELKASVKKVKLMSSPSPERKLLNKKSPLEPLNNSPKLSSVQRSPLKNTLPDVGIQRRATPDASPSAERKPKIYKPKQQKRLSPYSQSLDVVSPPIRHKSSKKLLIRNLSSDSPSEKTNKKQKKVLPTKTNRKLLKSAAELDKPLINDTPIPPEAGQRGNQAAPLVEDKENSKVVMKTVPQPLTTANQLNMKPVLDKICYSIKSIRQITQSKRPSCLEKSNSLPDFSSHVASTFGSSSQALLAFLSVMTLKELITSRNMDELNMNNVSCAEALKMIDSLAEIANIEDSHTLKTSLSDLQQSTSKQLLQSWKGFQELSDRCRSRSSTANNSEEEFITSASPDQGNCEESVIDELIESLDIPEKLKEELASLSLGAKIENTVEISERIVKGVEKYSKFDNYLNQLSTEDGVNAPQEDKMNVDVRSIIKKFTQPDEPSAGNLTERFKTVDQSAKDTDPQQSKTKRPQQEQITEGRQSYSKSFVQENLQSCRVHEENQDKPKHKIDNTLNANVMESLSCKTKLDDKSCYSNSEKQDSDCSNLQKNRNLPKTEFSHYDSGSDVEVQKMMITEETSSQKDRWKQSAAIPDTHERKRSEEAEEEGEDSPILESQSEEDKGKQPSPAYYVEVNLRGNDNVSSSEGEKHVAEAVKCKQMCNSSEKETQKLDMGLNVSADDSTETSDDVDESLSEEERPEVEFKQLQVIVEETSSGIEEEEEEEEHVYVPPPNREQTAKFNMLEAVNEETEEDNVSSGDEYRTYSSHQSKQHSTAGNDGSILAEDDVSYTKKDREATSFKFNTDDDSGNDHRSCEEHVDEDRLKLKYEQLSCSMEEELSYDDKEFSSDEEDINKSNAQEGAANGSGIIKCGITMDSEMAAQSVAERVILLEQQVADSQKTKHSAKESAIRQCPQRNAPLDSEEESSSESPTSLHAFCTRSAPQSSLSFSYDSSGVITTEPEGRVRSIREMFLAKSTTDIQPRRLTNAHASELLENRGETSVSGGYQTQTSCDLSSSEDDSARQSITKGFVRRTIEMLYGKKDAHPNEEAGERPPSAPKCKEHSSILSSFHAVRSKAMSELSYFNSANALDSLTEATRCIAFNAQVGPGHSVPIDDGRWLLRENALIRKSISDPVGINKTFSNAPDAEKLCEGTDEHTPYSLFSTKGELEDKAKTLSRKCTYFSLPHCSDSDAGQDEVSKGSLNGDTVVEAKDDSEDSKTWAERNGKLPSVGLKDYKIMDNKVHPLTEPPPDAEVVKVQPMKGQGAVNRRLQDPDMLDFLYNFCGQNCPIL